MAARSPLAAWLTASLLLAACNFYKDGLGAASEETDDGGGLVGLPGSGGSLSSGAGAGGAGTGGAPGGGTGGALGPDPAPPPPPDAEVVIPPPPPPDAEVVIPPPPPPDAEVVIPPPPPPDAAVVVPPPPPPRDAAPVPRDAPPAVVPPDAGISSPVNTVACGNARCVVGQQACCVTAGSSTCIPFAGLCPGGAARRCDGPEDCDMSRVCCARPDPQGGYRSVCNRAMECAQQGGAAMCRTAADCPGPNRTCAPVALAGSVLNVCR